jgi:hypothetical protein
MRIQQHPGLEVIPLDHALTLYVLKKAFGCYFRAKSAINEKAHSGQV